MRATAILLTLLTGAAAFAQEQEPEPEPFSETIFVVRYALDVRVVDSYGNAIDDLAPEDFIVKVGKSTAHVEGAQWVSLGRRSIDREEKLVPEHEEDEEEAIEEPEIPRSIVLFIQTDFARNSMRILGQMKFNYIADDIIELFGPNDRIAVLSHDSHLKIRRDFTRDRASLRKAVRESMFIDYPPPPPAATDGPSILPLLDRTEMKRAAHAEAALLVIAKALRQIDGPRTIIPVISLNHGIGGQLSFGLAATAAATGGFYAGLQDFGSQAVTRVKGALAGHYALTLRIDDLLKPGQYPLSVRVNRKGAEVQAPAYVVHGQ